MPLKAQRRMRSLLIGTSKQTDGNRSLNVRIQQCPDTLDVMSVKRRDLFVHHTEPRQAYATLELGDDLLFSSR